MGDREEGEGKSGDREEGGGKVGAGEEGEGHWEKDSGKKLNGRKKYRRTKTDVS